MEKPILSCGFTTRNTKARKWKLRLVAIKGTNQVLFIMQELDLRTGRVLVRK